MYRGCISVNVSVKSLKSEGDLFKEREREKLSLVGKRKIGDVTFE